ncbi:hypothetical protein CPC08DRAFT_745725 [Agrocybe pediades]|nr:hypothetical protein CPC08DRAFT_745725 [Agrocybe pediades]
MFRSQDAHDLHLRALLDQRVARTDAGGRYSAVPELLDTPSVYSHHNFSPISDHDDRQYSYRRDLDYASPASTAHSRFTGEHSHVQSASMLDFDDDSRSPFPRTSKLDDEEEDSDDATQEGPDTASRMSYLGPKMRFHSRAPWEMEGDALDEECETEEGSRSYPPNFPFSRCNTDSRSSTFSSSSPRPSYTASRPSGESSIMPKRSFETVSSQISYSKGAMYALAQESLSSSSLARGSARPKEKLRNKFSLGRIRPEAPTAPMPSSPPRNRFPSPSRGTEKHPHSFETSNHSNTSTLYAHKNYNESNKETMHPYANPDLVVSYADDQSTPSNMKLPPPSEKDLDMLNMLNESYSGDSIVKSSSRSTLTPDTSVSSIISKQRTSTILLRNISLPVPVASSIQRVEISTSDNHEDHAAVISSGVTSLPGWTERNAVPAFSLISLEEARAQRMRSSTVNVPPRTSTSSGLSNSSTPFPAYNDGEKTNVPQTPETFNLSSLASRARGRSISAGAAKAKNAMHNMTGQPKERRDSDQDDSGPTANVAPVKVLKPKKSGFLRLFNTGKASEKEESSGNNVPPVPSLPETVNKAQSYPKVPKSPVHRIPVPSLSPSLLEVVAFQDSDLESAGENGNKKQNITSPRPTPPTLSINTIPANSQSRSSTSAVNNRRTHDDSLDAIPRPWLNDQPQSAPANVSEFPTLRLRPVSTLFSAHFGDHIVLDDIKTPAQTPDLDTPRSSSPAGMMSPITPGSSTRASNDKPLAVVSENTGSNLDHALREQKEQMSSARKAWQLQIWELQGQVRDLKAELQETKDKYEGDKYCQACGRGTKKSPIPVPSGGSVVNRPRARTGTSSRFTKALP